MWVVVFVFHTYGINWVVWDGGRRRYMSVSMCFVMCNLAPVLEGVPTGS